MRKNLTHASVMALKPPATGQLDYWDTRKPGFGIRVSKGGTKTWLLMYRQHGRKRRLTLGRFPEMSVAEARARATSTLGDVVKGVRPGRGARSRQGGPDFRRTGRALPRASCAREKKAAVGRRGPVHAQR